MDHTYVQDYVDEYEVLLNKVNSKDKNINENDMQNFLEKHTAFIPTPFFQNHLLHFNCFISKFPIGPWISDIAYLTHSTVGWYVVLMELENPHKKIFKGRIDHAEFTSDFTQAKQQISDWKIYIDEYKADVLESLKRLLKPLAGNRVAFKYAIVMGRRGELDKSESRRRTLAELEKENLKVLTYDTILSDYKRFRRVPSESIVIKLYNKNKFKIKYLPNNLSGTSKISTPMFSYMSCEDILLTDEQINKLQEDGYEMGSWQRGELLELNERNTKQGGKKAHPYNIISELL